MLEQRSHQRSKRPVVERPDVDIPDLGAERASGRNHLEQAADERRLSLGFIVRSVCNIACEVHGHHSSLLTRR
jgi:hypothetical protein